MPDDRFDGLLTGAVDTASRAARPPGAAAARTRGRQRRSRRRITAAALAVVLLSGAGAAAAASVSGGHRNVPIAITTRSGVTSAGPTTSPSLTPTQRTSASAATGETSASPSTPSSAATTPSESQSSIVAVPDPGSVVAGGWLSASRLPFGTGYQGSWQVLHDVGGTLLGDSVYQQSSPLLFCGEDMTGSALSVLRNGLSGDQFKDFVGQNVLLTSQVIGAYADQETLFYPSSVAAQSAWDTLDSDYAACAQQMTGTDPTTDQQLTGSVRQTVGESDAQCWSTLDLGSNEVKNPVGDLMHVCLVRSGSLISAAVVYAHGAGSLSPVDFGPIDASTIAALRQALGAYGTGN